MQLKEAKRDNGKKVKLQFQKGIPNNDRLQGLPCPFVKCWYISSWWAKLAHFEAISSKQAKTSDIEANGWVSTPSHYPLCAFKCVSTKSGSGGPQTMSLSTSAGIYNDIQPGPISICHIHMLQEVNHHSCAQENNTSLPEWLLPTHLCRDEVLWTASQGLHLFLTTLHTWPTTVSLPSQLTNGKHHSTHHPHHWTGKGAIWDYCSLTTVLEQTVSSHLLMTQLWWAWSQTQWEGLPEGSRVPDCFNLGSEFLYNMQNENIYQIR